MLFILSRDFEVVTVANNVGNALPYFNDLHIQNLEAGTGSYQFEIPSNHKGAELVIEGNYVVRIDLDGKHLMFTIMNVEETHNEQKIKSVYCESAGLELLNEVEVAYPLETSAKDIRHYVNKAISGTGWQIGYCDVTAKRTLEFTEYENVLSRLLKIASYFDNAEIDFSVELKGLKVNKRLVNIYKKRGEDNGKRFTYSKNVTSITRTVEMSEVATALYCVGKADSKGKRTRINTQAYDDGDIFSNQTSDYVHSRVSLQRWGQVAGHIFRIFEYDTTSSTELLNRAISDLKKRQNPSVTYEVSVALLERLAGMEEEQVRIGDTIKVIDTAFSPELYLEARVVELQTSYLDPTKDRCVLGNYKIVKSDISKELRDIQSILMEKEAQWSEIYESIYKDMIAPQNPEINDLWLDTSIEPNRLKRWDGTKWVLAGVYDPEQLGVYPKEEIDEMIDFTEWYAGVKAGSNLVRNIYDNELEEGYEWIDDVTPDGTIGKVLRKRFTGGTTASYSMFTTDRITVDPTKTYLLEFYVKANDTNSTYYFGREEETDDGVENDQGNAPYIVEARIPNADDVGKWRKHFALIPPHYAGLENSHATDQSSLTPDVESKFWNVNTGQIFLKLFLTYNPIDPLSDSEMLATGFGLYEVRSSDSLYEEIGDLANKIGEVDNRTTDIEIINTVVASPDFDSILSDKANIEDITGLATGDELTGVKEGLEGYIDGRLDGEGGINEKINAVSSDLEKTANSITAKFSSSGGVNLLLNSLSFGGLDFWEPVTEGTITLAPHETLQNQELESLGFGSGFYSPLGTNASLEQTVNTSRDREYSLSFWVKKNQDSGVNANAGIEIYGSDGNLIAFVGKLTGEVTNGYELGRYSFTTDYNELTIRIVSGEGAESIISGLMLNVGTVTLQWSHHPSELYNSFVKMNQLGLRVWNDQYDGFTVVSPSEFSGYFLTTLDNGQQEMQKVFTLNKATTEVTKIQIDEEIILNPLKIQTISSESYNGWAIIPTD